MTTGVQAVYIFKDIHVIHSIVVSSNIISSNKISNCYRSMGDSVNELPRILLKTLYSNNYSEKVVVSNE